MYAEATGEAQSENRLCCLRVVEWCRESGEDNAQSHEYLLALLSADAPEVEEARQQFLAALGDSSMEQREGKSVPVCTRQPCQEIGATNGRHPCPRWQQPDEHEEK